jgi:hypothetical protein
MGKQVIILKENTLESLVQDTFTFASIVFSFWFNYRFIGNNHTLDILLFITFFMLAMGRAGNYKRLKEVYEPSPKPKEEVEQ